MTDLQRTPKWFEARKNRITASNVGAILGLSPYMTRASALRSMVRAREGASNEFNGNIATSWGTQNESGALFDYEMQTTHKVTPVGFLPFEDWAGASPDGLIGEKGLLEIKCPYGIRNDNPPAFKSLADQPHYYAQVQFQLYCTGRTWAHFFQWANHEDRLELVEIDQDWINENIPVLRQFYAEFLDEPAQDHISDARIIIDTPEAAMMVREYDELSESIENAIERCKELLADMVALADERNAIISSRKLTQTNRLGAISYAKLVKDHCPKIDVEPYRGKPQTFWVLT